MSRNSVIIGATAAATLLLLTSKKSSRSGGSSLPDYDLSKCPPFEGGPQELEGVRFYEVIIGDADPSDPLPMIFWFHALAAKPESYLDRMKNLDAARLIVPFGKYESTKLPGYFKWFESGIRHLVNKNTDEYVYNHFMETANWIAPFVRAIYACRNTLGRPVFAGGSMGGEMSYLLNATMPGFAGLTVSLNGALPEPLWSSNITTQVGLHGEYDDVVPYDWDLAYNQWLQDNGAPATFYTYGTDHGWSKDNPKEWNAEYNKMSRYQKDLITNYVDALLASA